jgi:hypothetical protein
MHPLLLFIGIFGGIEAFGGWGLILGPLTLALFVAAFRLVGREREARRIAASTIGTPEVISTNATPAAVSALLTPADQRT